MPTVRPFRAYRYDMGRIGTLGDVLAHDGDTPTGPHHAAHLFHSPSVWADWLREDVVVRDSSRSLYLVHQEFTYEGTTLVRKGFLALLGNGEGWNPGMGLYDDPDGEVITALERAVGRQPPIEARDRHETLHRLWAVNDPQTLSDVVGRLSASTLLVVREGALMFFVGQSDPAQLVMTADIPALQPALPVGLVYGISP